MIILTNLKKNLCKFIVILRPVTDLIQISLVFKIQGKCCGKHMDLFLWLFKLVLVNFFIRTLNFFQCQLNYLSISSHKILNLIDVLKFRYYLPFSFSVITMENESTNWNRDHTNKSARLFGVAFTRPTIMVPLTNIPGIYTKCIIIINIYEFVYTFLRSIYSFFRKKILTFFIALSFFFSHSSAEYFSYLY